MVLKNISFHLEKGKSIGIVGQTGSGKSSIINLITGFYETDDGNIFINHINTNSINIKDIRNKTALVMQDPVLFSGTIRENIAPSGMDMDNARLEKALHNGNCDFLFETFSGLDTMIKEGGRPLSSGQKQLVCIARAFAFNPDLIIFDEATSYMDSQSEQKVHDAMNKLMKGRLSIIIAHRLSTVRNCDTILLLRDGTIREQGSHNELVDLKGEYYHLLKKEKI
jgi:ATP-binding cassette subfamily B protein